MWSTAKVWDNFCAVSLSDFLFFQICAVLNIISITYRYISIVNGLFIQVSNCACCCIKIIISAKSKNSSLIILFLNHFHVSNCSNSLLELNEFLFFSCTIKWDISKKYGRFSAISLTIKFCGWIHWSKPHCILSTSLSLPCLMHSMRQLLIAPLIILLMLLLRKTNLLLLIILWLTYGLLWHYLPLHPALISSILLKYLNIIISIHMNIIRWLLLSCLISWSQLLHTHLSLLFIIR